MCSSWAFRQAGENNSHKLSMAVTCFTCAHRGEMKNPYRYWCDLFARTVGVYTKCDEWKLTTNNSRLSHLVLVSQRIEE